MTAAIAVRPAGDGSIEFSTEFPAAVADAPCVAGNGCTRSNCLFTGDTEEDQAGQAACDIC